MLTQAAQLITAIASLVGALTGLIALVITSRRVLHKEKHATAGKAAELADVAEMDREELLEIAEHIKGLVEHSEHTHTFGHHHTGGGDA